MMKFKILSELIVNLSNLALNTLDKQIGEQEIKKQNIKLQAFKPQIDTMLFDIIKRKSSVIKAIEPQTMEDILPYDGKSFLIANKVGIAFYKIENASISAPIKLESVREILNKATFQYARENKFTNVKYIKASAGKEHRTYLEIVIEYQMK